MLLRNRQLYDGVHLPPVARRMRANAAQSAAAAAATTTTTTAASRRPRRYLLKIRTSDKPWAAAGTAAMGKVFGTDQLGRDATALFQSALQEDTYENYESNLRSFISFCEVFLINPLEATPVDIARYLAWLGQRGTIAADSLHPYLSAINRYLQDHAREPVALGPLVAGVRKGLANS